MSIIKKEYVTFRELCNRWKIDSQDMHYLVSKGDLVPSIAWNQYLVECRLTSVVDGNAEFSFQDRHNYIEKSSWLYLQFPKPTGRSAYNFSYASKNHRPLVDDSLCEEPWYLLCGRFEYEGAFPPESIRETYVETECVFMEDSVADCEVRHPELLEASNRVEISRKESSGDQQVAHDKWPWGNYETENLRRLSAAAQKFWKLYDPSDPSTAPTNKDVGEWLRAQGVSNRIADAMATILRADGLPTGPR